MKINFWASNLSLVILGAMLLTSCQQKGSSTTTDANDGLPTDSIVVNKIPFDKDPKRPVEWEVTMKKSPDGTYFRHGEAKRYSASGKLAEKLNYVNNKKEGADVSYYLEGQVWKEQSYTHGKLNGVCKRYNRKGGVEAEYSYNMGLPGVGLKEFTSSGKEKPTPSLAVSQTNEIKATGYLRLNASLSGEGLDRISKVDYYEGALIDGKYADLKTLTPFRAVGKDKGEMLLSVPKDTFIDKDVTIVAVAITKTGLKLILTKTIHVGVRGV